MTRFVLEGEWTGYRSSQQRVVHREIISKDRAERLKSVRDIMFTDGTRLLLNVRPARYREQVKTILAYSSLIRNAEKSGETVFHVASLEAA